MRTWDSQSFPLCQRSWLFLRTGLTSQIACHTFIWKYLNWFVCVLSGVDKAVHKYENLFSLNWMFAQMDVGWDETAPPSANSWLYWMRISLKPFALHACNSYSGIFKLEQTAYLWIRFVLFFNISPMPPFLVLCSSLGCDSRVPESFLFRLLNSWESFCFLRL